WLLSRPGGLASRPFRAAPAAGPPRARHGQFMALSYNSPMPETRVGSYLFPDGVTRPIFQDEMDGWQYTLDQYGGRVYSMWLFSEAEWQACTEPAKMLQFLPHRGAPSTRKLQLFACACCRRILRFKTDDGSRAAVEAAEEYADGLISIKELNAR